MPPRGFTNPAPKTESARSALSAFTCNLCNKTYSRHPEYEAHISSYDHQHRKRLQDLKQLSRDPNAAEKARRAERKADAEAGLRVIDASNGGKSTSRGGGGFKKGGFKSSFATVQGPAAPAQKNVLGDNDDGDGDRGGDDGHVSGACEKPQSPPNTAVSRSAREDDRGDAESDTDEEYVRVPNGEGYYDPLQPTGCYPGCPSLQGIHAGT